MDELVQRMMLWIVKCSSISFKLKLLMWYSETDIIIFTTGTLDKSIFNSLEQYFLSVYRLQSLIFIK